MPLDPGTRLGPYEIVGPLGAGGMGEVYRARDTRLQRDVAVKVLPPAFASDPERLARFEQEARAAAALNHPNILAVFDIGTHPSTGSGQAHSTSSGQALSTGSGQATAPYIVSELLEGETLRERLGAGAIPARKAIEYGVQVAHGLAAAHEKGIVHRDLKPENIFITADSRVKILDFGLAKLTQAEPTLAGMSALPTTPGMPGAQARPDTLAGIVLGTLGYMAPEQVRGQTADHRADIFAFGAILYEMLAGQRAFSGDTPADTMSAILAKDPPDLSVADGHIPPGLARIVDRCIEKNSAARFQSTRDLAFALEALTSHSGSRPVDDAVRGRSRWLSAGRSRVLAWSVAGLCLALAAGILFVHVRETPPPAPQSVRFQIPPPGATAAEMFALSADGGQLAFVASAGGAAQLWLRDMETLEPRALPGTDGAIYPFWSPDGRYLGFFAQSKLKKIAVAGGPPQTLCDATDGRGGTWNRDGVIVFSDGPTSPLRRVSAAGGVPAPVTTLNKGDAATGHRFPIFLPDGVHVLYNVGSSKPDSTGLYLGALDGGTSARLLPDNTNAIYAPPASPGGQGYLVFRREDTLMAQPFDPKALRIAGEMFPLAAQVPISRNLGFGAFSVSGSGVLVYRMGGATANRSLVWMDRTGKRLGTVAKPGAFDSTPRLSPDEATVAVAAAITSGAQSDIWLQDLRRDVSARFTFRPGLNRLPVWSPDGTHLAFAVQGLSAYSSDIYQKSSAGNGQEELLLHGGVNAIPLDWSPDGKWVLYSQTGQNAGNDLWLLPLDGDRKPVTYLQTPFNEAAGAFSPDGRWMAYQSDESGQNQIYVQTVPVSGAKNQISTAGGTDPRWRRDGKELFYVSSDQKLMAVPIALGARVEPGTPQALFTAVGLTGYAPSRDGQRFLVNVPAGAEGAAAPPITVVLNWAAGLKN